ncbi:septal ring lytic transglycosylase RlpA family protein [Roseomonas sp. KE2513]|uniref:septal ring lytic transglycosylase RlpA family protein n=1 Tax=Roseomonas sp. KE2513 TaxID=2479202 RepID=UPI0018E0304F|nr:septal ring lytic transglycosylase RlpA family protein [Roseomonas sp. KE2513]MBI0536306.1 septal ring lytic transglycosylase RlpA family protein [Roseomonas sp. KE2513]
MGKAFALLAFAAAVSAASLSATAPAEAAKPRAQEQRARPGDDTSGRVQRGRASHYHRGLNGRRMANGERFSVNSNSAASRTLPLGTTARVKNLETGRTATVEVEDRGPYVRGRILDVSPRTAQQLGMLEDGVAPVEISPVEVPQRDGTIRQGAGSRGG